MEREFRPGLRVAAGRLAGRLGVDGRTVAMVENATQAVNAVLRSFDFRPGDEILVTNQTYNSVRNTVRWVAALSGARLVQVDLPFPARSLHSLMGAFTAGLSERTRLSVCYPVTSPTPLLFPRVRLGSSVEDAA